MLIQEWLRGARRNLPRSFPACAEMACLAVIASVILFVPARGQSQSDPRDTSYASEFYTIYAANGTVAERGYLEIPPPKTGEPLRVNWSNFDADDVSTNLPMDRVGTLLSVADHLWLVSGDRQENGALTGVLCLLSCDMSPTQNLTISAVQTCPALDLHRIAWNATEHVLYSVNWEPMSVAVAPWLGPSQPLPGSFTTILTGNQVPYSDANDWRLIKTDPGIAGFRITSDKIFPWAWVRLDANVNQVVVTYDPPLVIGTTASWNVRGPIPCRATARQSNGSTVEGRKDFVLAGPQGVVHVVDSDGTTAIDYTLAADWQYQTVEAPVSFNTVPGRLYTLTRQGSGASDLEFRPTVRFGYPINSSSVTLWHADPGAEFCTVGNAEYSVTGEALLSDLPQADFELSCYLSIGVRNPDGTDPVDVSGTSAILNPVASQGFLQPVRANVPHAQLAFDLPIANDDTLAGAVFLYQWVTLNPDQTISYSEVFGTAIQPSSTVAARSSSSGPSWETANPTEREAIRETLVQEIRYAVARSGLRAPSVDFADVLRRMREAAARSR